MKSSLAKYKLGLLVIGLLTLGLFGLLVVQASATKADKKTYQTASDIADKLNSYSFEKVPNSLAEAGVKNVPSSISYTKLSSSSYKFCVTYKAGTSDFDAAGTLTSLATGGALSSTSDYSDSSYLVVNTSHKKGKNCQTISLYGSTINGSFNTLKSSGSNDSSSSSSSSGSKQDVANDSERKTDINALQSQLEAYYAQNGYYPSSDDVNSATWRTTNMKGLDAGALCDPASKSTSCQLTSDTSLGSYSYVAYDDNYTPCTTPGQHCTSYTVSAELSTNDYYDKYSLNY